MVSHDVLRDCAHHALTEWQHAEYQGNWHPLPAAKDVWEGRWLTGFHFQVACPGGGVSNCHPFFVKQNVTLPADMFVGRKPPVWAGKSRNASPLRLPSRFGAAARRLSVFGWSRRTAGSWFMGRRSQNSSQITCRSKLSVSLTFAALLRRRKVSATASTPSPRTIRARIGSPATAEPATRRRFRS